ncbi:ChaN family lipoprotein [Thiohalomonas denitrificans]|uniref:ChaN family lipoprotein n=1 Tax=Thiohalomonas denitrificans TaxID=415747 RepID=UPI0026EEA346|nr:ChaN family lipoprotein [Thiohalomonas denitrificans]
MTISKVLLPATVLLLCGCATAAGPELPGSSEAPATFAVDLRDVPRLEAIMPQLTDNRVVFVGESHDRYSHHLNQLAIIRGMHERHPDLVIGLEFFQQPFQPYLDDYVAGKISEKEMLRGTEYYSRWKFDYRLYRPILNYAREQGLKLLALNVPEELTRKVARQGFDGLEPAEQAQLPEIGEAGEPYRQRLQAIYNTHPHEGDNEKSFEHFMQAQLLWDEGMAERAADFLREHPERAMVLLAGSGHLAYGIGIPSRLERRVAVTSALVLNDPQEELTPDIADFVLMAESTPLPSKGRLGIFMGDSEDGVLVRDFTEESAAQSAGLQREDRIVRIDGQPIDNTADVQLALLDGRAGDTVTLMVERDQWLAGSEQVEYSVTLR